MPVVTIVCGLLLIAVGVWAKVWTGTTSNTALIPAFLGAPLLVAGLVALKESLLKHAMHFAAVVGLLGFLGGVVRIAMTAWGGDVNWSETKNVATLKMTIICAVFVALCVNSFIQARKRRAEREAQEKVAAGV